MATISSDENKRPAHPIGSVENALKILVLLRDRASLRVSDAAEELGVARSTAHRLLAMLAAYDVVEQEPRSRAYRAGKLLEELGTAALRHSDDVLTVLHPFLRELGAAVDETVHLIVLEGANCRFIDSVESHQALRTTARVGIGYPAYTTSGGKALLATLDDAEILQLYPREQFPSLNDKSITTRTQLLQELDRIRELGYATNFGESELGIAAVAMAQVTSSGDAPAAIAVSAPEQRVTPERVEEFVTVLRQVTARARRRLP